MSLSLNRAVMQWILPKVKLSEYKEKVVNQNIFKKKKKWLHVRNSASGVSPVPALSCVKKAGSICSIFIYSSSLG